MSPCEYVRALGVIGHDCCVYLCVCVIFLESIRLLAFGTQRGLYILDSKKYICIKRLIKMCLGQ